MEGNRPQMPGETEGSAHSDSVQGFSPDAVIQAGRMTVAVSNSILSGLLDRIMEAVVHAC